jgi:hypothetical protein
LNNRRKKNGPHVEQELLTLPEHLSSLPDFREELEDTKGVIRICISKKNRQHNGQKKKDKRTNSDRKAMNERIVITTNGIYPWTFVGRYSFRNG